MASFDEIFVSLSDGYRAYGRYWKASDPRGAVLYHHGIQSHCGWYQSSAAALADAGYGVLQVDRRGSGRNMAKRGHAESADQLIGDALAARDDLCRRSGAGEHHVVGVSWGGKLAVAAYAADQTGVLSLNLVTPGLFPVAGASREEAARIGFAMLYEPHKHFDIPLNNPELFTAVTRWQRFFRSDELTLRQCTAGFYLASRRLDKTVQSVRDAPPVPIHLFLAGEERIIDNEKTADFFQELNWPGLRITRYARARHSLEFECDPGVYFGDLVSFIDDVEKNQHYVS